MDNKKKLIDDIYVDFEYDQGTMKNRKVLYPILKAAWNTKGYKKLCKLEGDTLTLKGKRYTTKNIGDLSTELNGFHVSSKSDEETYTFFWELNPFSNFHPSPFTINNTTYKTSKHFIQSEKARHFGDSVMEMSIIECDTALEAKRFGHMIKKPKEVRNLDEIAKDMCFPGIEAKFEQNEPLMILLQSTSNQSKTPTPHQ